MKIAFFRDSVFLLAFKRWLDRNKHEYKHYHYEDLGEANRWCDIIWHEWTPSPLSIVLENKRRPVVGRCLGGEILPKALKDQIPDWTKQDVMIHVSDWARDRFIKLFGEPCRLEVVPNIIDCELYSPADHEHDSHVDIGMVAASTGRKGLKYVPYLLRNCVRIHLHVRGIHDVTKPWVKLLRKRAEELGVENRLEIGGWIPIQEMPEFWKQQDIVLSMSCNETFGVSIAEGMASGCYPIVGWFPGADGIHPVWSLVGDEPDKWNLARHYEVSDFAHRINSWIDETPGWKHEMAMLSRKWILGRYDVNVVCPMIMGILEGLVK